MTTPTQTIHPTAATAGRWYPCGLCNEFEVPAAGDLCPRCAGDQPIMCTRCGQIQLQYGPCIHCETGR